MCPKGDDETIVVLGAKACVSIIPGSASLVNRVFTGFLSQLPRSRSDLRPPAISTLERTRIALQTLSELVGDPSIAHRNPKSVLSFSCVTPEVAKSQLESLKFYARDIDKTYCPLGRDGRPIRKYETISFYPQITPFLHHDRYSERKLALHWFHGDSRGISHVGKCPTSSTPTCDQFLHLYRYRSAYRCATKCKAPVT